MSETAKFVQTESRLDITEERGEWGISTEWFLFGMMERFWKQILVRVAQQYEYN